MTIQDTFDTFRDSRWWWFRLTDAEKSKSWAGETCLARCHEDSEMPRYMCGSWSMSALVDGGILTAIGFGAAIQRAGRG